MKLVEIVSVEELISYILLLAFREALRLCRLIYILNLLSYLISTLSEPWFL